MTVDSTASQRKPATTTPSGALPHSTRTPSRVRAIRALDDPRDLDARAGVQLAEHVPDVRLDGLRAEEELARDLAVGLAPDDHPGDLELARRECRKTHTLRRRRLRPAVDALAEPAQLALRLRAVAHRSARAELVRGAAEQIHRALALPTGGEGAAGQDARPRAFDARRDRVGELRR